MIKNNKPKLTREAGKQFPAFSFYSLFGKLRGINWISCICLLLLLMASCRPKTGEAIAKPVDPIPQDTIVIIDGDPNEEEGFLEPIIDNSKEEEIPLPQLLLTFEKRGCYGHCPEFKCKVFSDGHLIYTGLDQVDKMGQYETRIDPLRLEEIYQRAAAIRFFELAEFYPLNEKQINELPTTITFLKKDNLEKTITSNHDSPVGLRRFEQYIVNWLGTMNWNKIQQMN